MLTIRRNTPFILFCGVYKGIVTALARLAGLTQPYLLWRYPMQTQHGIDEAAFKELVRKKWTISLILTAIMLVVYYGFILVLAFEKQIFAQKIGESMTLGIPVGLGVILLACLLTGIYVRWANSTYDSSVKSIIEQARK